MILIIFIFLKGINEKPIKRHIAAILLLIADPLICLNIFKLYIK